MSGAKAFNAVVVQREIERWIEKKKKASAKKSGPTWGVLVHGNRILESAVFKKLGSGSLSQPIASFAKSFDTAQVDKFCEEAYASMSTMIPIEFPGKFLAVLFKNFTASKRIFEAAVK